MEQNGIQKFESLDTELYFKGLMAGAVVEWEDGNGVVTL